MVINLLKKVETYQSLIENNQIDYPEKCPKCKKEQFFFYRHEVRKRIFYVIVERLVWIINSCLMRWRCPNCRKTFTQYPDFALPNKRYIQAHVIAKSLEYACKENLTYRKSFEYQSEKICYQELEDGKQIAHSTLWHWVSFTGKLENVLREVLEMIKQKSTSNIFRKFCHINPKKYRTKERKKYLETSQRLDTANQTFQEIFSRSIFPLKIQA